MSEQKVPLNWPTAIVLVGFFAAIVGVVWAIAYMITS